MARRAGIILLASVLMCIGASAQNPVNLTVCPYYPAHQKSLACLIPDVTQTGASQNLSRFNTTVAQVIGQLPLAAPVSGFVLGFDKKLGIPVEENQNLGSVLTERGNTVGKHKLFLGFTYQRFVFSTIDGISLNNLPSVYQIGGPVTTGPNTTQEYGSSMNGIGANLSQYTGIVAFGLTDRIDVSVTVPVERVSLSAGYSKLQNGFLTYQGTISNTVSGGVTTPNPSQNYIAGSASGIGDILINMKGTIFNWEKSKIALGTEVRFPTGDEYNLLGTGAYGVKPYIVFSRLGRVTPHVNVGYQWNDFSNLYVNPCHFNGECASTANSASLPTLRLPDSLDYSAGADLGLVKRLTLVGDFVGQHYFNAPRVTAPVPASQANPAIQGIPAPNPSNVASVTAFNNAFAGAQTVGVNTSGINVDNVALGLKVNPVGRLIISVNALVRLDNGSLRPNRFVPLVGLSYRF